jgi:hypothetical protein
MSLWTKVRGAVVGIAAPIVGGFIGGPAGAAIGAKLGASYASTQTASLMGGGPVVGPGGGGAGVSGGGMVPVGATGTWMGRYIVGARGIVRNIAGKIIGVMRGTSLFRNARVVGLVKTLGIPGAAVALGILVSEVSEMFVQHAARPGRRARGISGRDIKCTRRTLGKIRSVQRLIGLPGARRAPSRARPAVAVRCD